MFPTMFAVTSMGIANLFSRTVGIFASVVAELPYPTPMIIFTAVNIVAGISALFIIDVKEDKQKESINKSQ